MDKFKDFEYRIQFNLQLFAQEKTEEATEKKKRDTRKKGQVVQSKDINVAVNLLFIFTGINIFKGFIIKHITDYYFLISNLMESTEHLYNVVTLSVLLKETLLTILYLSMPFLLIALFTGLILSYLQVGFLFTTETLKFKLEKINPISGFKRLFSIRSIVELLKSVFKAFLILWVTYKYLEGKSLMITHMVDLNLPSMISIMWDLTYGVVIRSSLILFVIAIFDYMYKKWQNRKDTMMSKQEIKEEYKQTEGDPLLKSKIKEKQRQMAMSRMMQEVPSADVVITNPTHFAIAIRYNASLDSSPKVLAKGQDLIANNIKKKATENGVPIVENKPLARALYSSVEVGDELPAEFFEPVAEVLAYVYNLRK